MHLRFFMHQLTRLHLSQRVFLTPFLVLALAGLHGEDLPPVQPTPNPANADLLAPFWKTPAMAGDPLLFVQAEGGTTPTASLLFTPTAAPCLTSATGETIYQIGRDFTWAAGSRELALTKDSRIPFMTAAQLHPPLGTPHSMANGQTALFWSEGHVFHDLQTVASYPHADAWDGVVPRFAGEHLPKTLARLKSKQPLTVVALGDSITAGYNASAFVKAQPMQPAYPQLITAGLRTRYQADVKLVNLAVSGKASAWGLTMAGAVAAGHPDLVIIAFGMNETGSPADQFADHIRAIIAAIRQVTPEAEFLLVAGMAGNPEWSKLHADAFPKFRDALATLCGNGVVLADVTSLWLAVRQHKLFFDITGNGLNHPNDFGQRLYAQVLTALLVE